MVVFGLVPCQFQSCTFQVQPVYASPGSYSHSFAGITFTVEGAEFWDVLLENVSTAPLMPSQAHYRFYADRGHEITVTASMMSSDVRSDFLQFEFLSLENNLLDTDTLLGTNEPARTLQVAGSFVFNGSCGAKVDGAREDSIIHILFSFFLEPTITPSTTPAETPTQPTPQDQLDTYPSLTINSLTGDVEVLWAESETDWSPATLGMILRVGDSIKTKKEFYDRVALAVVESMGWVALADFYVAHGGGVKVLPPEPAPKPFSKSVKVLYFKDLTPPGFSGSYYIKSSPSTSSTSGANPRLCIETPDAIITDVGTQFEVLVDDTGTMVRTFSGFVYVTDINNTYFVTVGENQTTSVPKGGYPYVPTLFDSSTVDRWWEALPSPTSTPTGFDLSNFTILLPLIVIVVVIVVAVIIAGVVWSKGRKTKTQVYYPAPPPPPNE